jgi:hypothetical protein
METTQTKSTPNADTLTQFVTHHGITFRVVTHHGITFRECSSSAINHGYIQRVENSDNLRVELYHDNGFYIVRLCTFRSENTYQTTSEGFTVWEHFKNLKDARDLFDEIVRTKLAK